MPNLTFRKQNSRNTSDHRQSITIKDTSDESQEIRASTHQSCPKGNYLLVPELSSSERGSRKAILHGRGKQMRRPTQNSKTHLRTLATSFAVAAPGEVKAGTATGHRAWQHPQKQKPQQNKRCQRIRVALWITFGTLFLPDLKYCYTDITERMFQGCVYYKKYSYSSKKVGTFIDKLFCLYGTFDCVLKQIKIPLPHLPLSLIMSKHSFLLYL